MGKPAARLTDSTAHGGTISAPGAPTVLIGKMPAAQMGNMHVCPMQTPAGPVPVPHVGGPLSGPVPPTVLVGGMPGACLGDMAVCVGPPSSVIMGCMTVMLGQSGGGGGGSAGSAAAAASAKKKGPKKIKAFPTQDYKEPRTENHFIDCEFTDSAGNPLGGVRYKITDPDNNEIIGVTGPEGKVRHDGYANKGNFKVEIQEVINAKWSKSKASMGDEMEFTADADGYENGTEADVSIVENIGNTFKTVETRKVKIKGKKIKGKWKSNYKKSSGDEPGTKGKTGYYTYITVEGKTAVSPRLELTDKLDIKVQDDKGQPLKDMDYEIKTPDGQVKKGKLGSNGEIKEKDIAPGEAEFKFTDIKPPDYLEITIQDQHGDPVTDTEFELELKKGASKKLTTDTWGKAKWGKAPDGPYKVKLIQSPGKNHQVHVVVKGDTLSEICQKYYGDMMLYPEIAEINKIKDPDLIYPDDKIKMPSRVHKLMSFAKKNYFLYLQTHVLFLKSNIIEIFIKTDDDSPISSEPFQIKMNDQVVAEGVTDENGYASLKKNFSGNYEIVLPNRSTDEIEEKRQS